MKKNKWYSASLLFETAINGDLSKGTIREMSVRLFCGRSEEAVRVKAEEQGRSELVVYDNSDGESVSWIFVGIDDVQEIDEEELGEGVEVFSRLSRKDESDGVETDSGAGGD